MSFRNRCMLAGAEGILSLSIPLKEGRNQRVAISEVIISDSEKWQSHHFKSLQSAYNRSPFFEYYRDELSDLYKKPFVKLADWNLHCLGWVKQKLNFPSEIRFTEQTIPYGSAGQDDSRDEVRPQNFSLWNPVLYHQVFEEKTGFLPNLSILDLLFNTGPEAADLLRQAARSI